MKHDGVFRIPTMVLLVYGLGTLVFFKGFSCMLPDLAGAFVGMSSLFCVVVNFQNDCRRFSGRSPNPGGGIKSIARVALALLSFAPTLFFFVCVQLFLGNALMSTEGAAKPVLVVFAAVSFVCFLVNDRNDRIRLKAMQTTKPLPPPPAFRTAASAPSAPKWLLPVGRSPWAIAAGYLGLVSFLLLPAPFALLFGILGLRDIRGNPNLCGKGRAWLGIIAGGVFSAFIVAVFLGLFSWDST